MGTELVFIVLLAVIVLVALNIALELIVPRRNPPIGEFLEVDGVRLHYIVRVRRNEVGGKEKRPTL